MATTGGHRARLLAALLLALASLLAGETEAKSFRSSLADDQVSAVIPSPNQADLYGSAGDAYLTMGADDIARKPSQPERRPPSATVAVAAAAANEAAIPVYASPFARSSALARAPPAAANFEHQDESSHAPPNYAPRPMASAPAGSSDLKASASYGHHQHGYGHGDHTSGWLDMGAWTGGKGSFGWYADYPVGGKQHHGYGRR